MNKQRTVIYEKRRHALMGERLGMDISDMIWDRVCNIMENNDFEGCRQRFLEILAMEFPLTEDRFLNGKLEEMAEEAYQKVMERFKQKTDIMTLNANKVIQMLFENNRDQIHEDTTIGVPVLAGNRQYHIPVNLMEAYGTECRSVVTAFHKALILHTIDDAWKENLRLLDELKHSVHNASYEQKDPLLIFKLEIVKLFDDMVNTINDRTVSIIMRAMIPELQVNEPMRQRQAPMPEHRQQQLQESRGELADASQQQAAARDTRDRQPVQPVRVEKLPGRNDPCPCGSGKKFKQCHGKNL
jgi:preprotein translocase subunit SecA